MIIKMNPLIFSQLALYCLILTSCSSSLSGGSPDGLINSSKSNLSELSQEPHKAELIYHWMQNTTEDKLHQMRGATGNKTFVHANGRNEVVFDENGKLVQDEINNGSLNYAHPVNDPLNHLLLDIIPWVYWGYSEKDPTSKAERLEALSLALGAGLAKAQKAKNRGKKFTDFTQKEKEAATVIYRVIQEGNVSDVYKILEDSNYKSENRFKIGQGLDVGLTRVFK